QQKVDEAKDAHLLANRLHYEASQTPHVPSEEPIHAKSVDGWHDLDELRHASHAAAGRILSRSTTFPKEQYLQTRERVVKAYDQLQQEHGVAVARLSLGASTLSVPTDLTLPA